MRGARRLLLVALAVAGLLPGMVRATPAAATAVKPALVGLLDRQGVIEDRWAGVVRGIVVEVGWNDLEPTPGAPLADGNPIDLALERVRAFNARFPATPMGIKLRVLAGRRAPEWLKARVGATFVTEVADGESGTVPFWWKPELGTAYAALQKRLSARYDAVAEIRETQITRCTVIHGEPFMRITTDSAALSVLRANGLTRSADEACLKEQVRAHKMWVRTRSVLALNPYQDPDAGGRLDTRFTVRLAKQCRSVLTSRCVIENHSIKETSHGPAYERLYVEMAALGRPLAMQTNRPEVLGDLGVVMRRCLAMGAEAIELPWTYRLVLVPDFLTAYGDVVSALDPAVVVVP